VGLGFEFRAYVLAMQVLSYLSHTSSHFYSGYFGDRVSHFAQAGLDYDLLILCLQQ
jgi:hypothetical protein